MHHETNNRQNVGPLVEQDTIVAVVVTYHPDGALAGNVEAALVHAGSVVIVDNTPSDRPPTPIRVASARPNVEVIRLGENRGVGAALNVGAEAARQRAATWLLTLDQDTALDPGWTTAVSEGYAFGGEETAVVGVSFAVPGRDGPAGQPTQGATDVARVITSGSLWSLDVLAAVGPFREDFVVDGIDNEMSFRVRSRGYRVVRSHRQAMEHDMGSLVPSTWRGRPFLRSGYGEVRYYYIFRNAMELMRLYGLREPRWLLQELRWLTWMAKSALVDRSPSKLAAMSRGVWDGLTRRFGPAPDAVLRAAASPPGSDPDASQSL